MNKNIVYLDYAATTPMAPEVIEVIKASLEDAWGNASSEHIIGRAAHNKLTHAVNELACALGVDADTLSLTSGATESINLAIKGAMHGQKKKHLITTTVEHKATLNVAQALIKEGYQVTFIAPNDAGQITAAMIEAALTPQTALISILWVNNETGECYPITEISAVARQHKVLLHVDATQAVPHFAVDTELVDLLSLTAHKCYGPKGIGLLYKRPFPKIPLIPIMDGAKTHLGNHVGTLPNHQIIGFGRALSLLKSAYASDEKINSERAEYLLNALAPLGVQRNARAHKVISAIINIHVPNVYADTLMNALPHACMAKGSACNSDDTLPSHVLTELGYGLQHAQESVRISLGRYLLAYDFKRVVNDLVLAITALQDWAVGRINTFYLPHFYHHDQSYMPNFIEDQTFTQTECYVFEDVACQLMLMVASDGHKLNHVNVRILATPFALWTMNKIIGVLRVLPIEALSTFKITPELLEGAIPSQELRLVHKLEQFIQGVAGP